MNKAAYCLILLMFIVAKSLYADWFDSFIEYRYQPELGKITISDGSVRGEKYVKRFADDQTNFAENNIFVEPKSKQPVVHVRENQIGPHKIKTIITTYAATMTGPGGANWTSTVEVDIDGRKKIDCSIGYYCPDRLSVKEIAIFPEDGIIEILAFNDDGKKVEPALEYQFIENPGVITNYCFKENE